jgi:hypothetical protein
VRSSDRRDLSTNARPGTSGRLTRAARIHGTHKIAVSEFPLPDIGPDELLLRVVSSSMCLSTYKALSLGSEHKRVPDTISSDPVITGHEFAGVIEEVGSAFEGEFTVGQSVAILPTMGLPTGESPGYSYPFFGGDATYCIVPRIAIEKGCVLPYDDGYYANGSLAEPMSCIIGAFHASYHTLRLLASEAMAAGDHAAAARAYASIGVDRLNPADRLASAKCHQRLGREHAAMELLEQSRTDGSLSEEGTLLLFALYRQRQRKHDLAQSLERGALLSLTKGYDRNPNPLESRAKAKRDGHPPVAVAR